jgi:cellobiose phosphorylase
MTVMGSNVVSVGYKPGSPGLEFDNTVMAIQYKIIMEPGETVVADLYLGIGEDKHSCHELLQKCDSRHLTEYLLQRTRSYSQTVLRRINATEDDAELFRRIACELIIREDPFRQEGPARYDAMFAKQYTFLLRMHKTDDIEVASHMIQMHAFCRLMGLTVNLIIWNEDPTTYHHFLQRMIIELIMNGVGAEALNRHQGGIFVKDAHNFSDDDYSQLEKADRIVTGDEWNALLSQVKWGEKRESKSVAPSLDLILN